MSSLTKNHLAISASAGSGKTWQLVSRYLALALDGVPPERIVALTFSRKAAAEIFIKIVNRLTEAADDPAKLQQLAADTKAGGGTLAPGDVVLLLRRMVGAMPRLRIGTLDSFFVQVLSAFPFEFGVPGGIRIMGEPEGTAARLQVIREILSGDLAEEAEQFIEAFKQAHMGKEERMVEGAFINFGNEYHDAYLTAPVEKQWGDPGIIWGKAYEWKTCAGYWNGKFLEETGAVVGRILNEKAVSWWTEMVEEMQRWKPGNPLQKRSGEIIKKFLVARGELESGAATITLNRQKVLFQGEAAQAVLKMVMAIIGCEFEAALHRTRHIFEVLRCYEDHYHDVLRRRGRLGFDDIQLVLNRGAIIKDRHAPLLSATAQGEENRLYIQYRLDGQFDHWLLDEFQDTSTNQWQILSNLIEEVLQVRDGTRSFFYVGDVKQAIYGWRKGDARLFDRVRRGPGGDERIPKQPLSLSWRSSPVVLETVNRVFENLPVDPAQEVSLPEKVIKRWEENWQTHRASPATEHLPGYAVHYRFPKAEQGEKDIVDIRHRFMGGIIQRWMEGGVDNIAVLVRTNAEGNEIAEYLRGLGVDTVCEGKRHIIDHPVIMALMSLIKLAEHPGDSLALNHVFCTPLGKAVRQAGLTSESLPLAILRDLHAGGYAAVLEHWAGLLHSSLADGLDEIAGSRCREMIRAALLFDEAGGGRVLDFLRYMEDYTVEEASSSKAVQVMTIHRSKGLEFNAVFLPDLQSASITRGYDSNDLLIHRRDSLLREMDWVLKAPNRNWCGADPVMARAISDLDEEATFENLCLLYVAMTRARQALVMLTTAKGESAKAIYHSDLLDTLTEGKEAPSATVACDGIEGRILYEQGVPDWYKATTGAVSEPEEYAEVVLQEITPASPVYQRLRRRVPSAEEVQEAKAEWLFSPGGREAVQAGLLIHELFQRIEWIENVNPAEIVRVTPRPPAFSEQHYGAACQEFLAAVKTEPVRKALSCPDARAVVWREQRFEMEIGGDWISGCFDRVVLRRDAGGALCGAEILDFKSDRVSTPEETAARVAKYAPQLHLYRQVLARLTMIPENAIASRLLFTMPALIVDVP